MFGLFSSSSRSSSTTTNTSTAAQTNQGDAFSLNNSYAFIEQIDQGLVEAAQRMVEEGLLVSENISEEALAAARSMVLEGLLVSENISEDALASARSISQEALLTSENISEEALATARAISQEALLTSENISGRALDLAGDAIFSNEMISREALQTSRSVIDAAEEMNFTNTQFLSGTMNDVVNALQFMDESRNIESGNVLDKVSELATVVQTGGESINANVNKLIMLAAIAMAGLVAWRAVK